jgi:uncharacterized membrane protein HdeD (DUF308 family)
MNATTDTATRAFEAESLEPITKNWKWLLALGILFIILGTIGLGMTFLLTIVKVLFLGVLLLIGGAAQLIEAFKHKGWKSLLWNIFIALFYLGAGVLVIYDPVGASIALTLVLAFALLAIGVFRIIMALQFKLAQVRWMTLLSGIASIVLGALILAQWPVSGLWVIGLFVAIELIIHGWSYVFIALAARRAPVDTRKTGTGAAST